MSEKQEKMTTAPVERLICSLALPSIAIMLITAMYNLADTYFVSGLGTSATAAIGVVFSLMGVIQAIGYFFGQGSGTFISRKLGAGENEQAAIMASTGFFLSLICGGVIAVFGLVFLKPLARLLGSSDTMLPYACGYMRWILVATPFMTASLTLNNQLRCLASAKTAMWGMLTGAILNMLGDPLLINVLHLGTSGAGLSTCFSQIVSFCILLAATFRRGNIPLRLKNFKPTPRMFGEISRGGIPSLLRQVSNSLGILCFNHAGKIFGDSAVAAISIVQRVTMMAISAMLGFSQGFQPVCGFNYGAKRCDRVLKAFWFSVKLITSCLFILAAAGAVFAPQIVTLFRPRDTADALFAETLIIGVRVLRFQCVTLPFIGLVTMFNVTLQTTGEAFKASLIAVCRSGLFLIPSVIALVAAFKLSGLEAAQLASDIMTIALAYPIGFASLTRMRRDVKTARTE